MDTRRLYSFVRIVDAGSITRAADILHIAQPALSQQMTALESHFGQQLLIRSKQGVEPTDAGKALYRHAQVILRQVESAQAEVSVVGRELAGGVSVGLAPYSTVAAIALPLLTAVRARYPSILLHINENFGGVLSEAMMTGRMDMALLYDAGPIKGVTFERLLTEELMVVAPSGTGLPGEVGSAVSLLDLLEVPLLLPGRMHTIRKVVGAAFESALAQPKIVAEVESVTLMGQAVRSGLGATVLPLSVARRMMNVQGLELRRIEPVIEVQVSLGTPANQPLSKPAEAVREVLRTVLAEYVAANTRPPERGQ
ncbi:nitrogen assimilation transcriptional regulator [Rhodococcus sp. BP-252]|uniref:nitrogen assimilation transcriptional regulator NAC n=1 Tax=Nocardiaceae TaxID=85025 RepID=UPI000A867F11|nr:MULTISPECIES: nitrogen assimilation transcriptional regulator NAC [Rhodococcus]MBY6410205.1 nitrogen assimilation transcriptional regulator [Rhodococcus sp. BP-320]MBY6415174.1 nitrogen assimilation transcriptional regulator [Rhodococcus sp. BP-321]MBY6421497.1 nitrogen assimilation transcriptional regulator [Rhodococcus sp. BP-324]MBY6425518.1 nitrogen assimilation transcriptional regulator [Rhodococcus sp. BP-323]MBY6430070.1 nitrogen assimilation transcriptional regulator [Rhodococcus sp